MSSCSQQMLLLRKKNIPSRSVCCWAGVFNGRRGCIMSPDMSGLATLHSFRRSFKWVHAKAINLLLGKVSIHQTLKTSRGSWWHAGERTICVEALWTNEGTTTFTMPLGNLYTYILYILYIYEKCYLLHGGYLDQTPRGSQRDVYQHKHGE